MAKLTVDEKRMEAIRKQLFGKEQNTPKKQKLTPEAHVEAPHRETMSAMRSNSTQAETEFLRGDLLKIVLLTAVAIGSQVILFILEQKHLISWNFRF